MADKQEHRLEQSFRTEHSGLLGFVRSRMQSFEEAEDLVQDVYMQALHNLNVLDAVDNLAGWLYTLARNKVIDWYRRKKVHTVSIEAMDNDGLYLQDILVGASEDWDEETRRLVSEALIESIDELPQKQQFVFIQHVVRGRTFRELAQESGDSINTLLARKRYAVRFLRDRLKGIKQILDEIQR